MTDRKTDTWHMRPNFKPRGRVPDDKGWLMIEPIDGSLPVLGDGFLGIEFHDETPDNVRRVGAFLDEHVKFITYTGATRPEWIDQCTAPGFWDTGLNSTRRWTWFEAACVESRLA